MLHTPKGDVVTRDLVRSALKAWKRTEALGRHPLASLHTVAARHRAVGYPDTAIGHGWGMARCATRGH